MTFKAPGVIKTLVDGLSNSQKVSAIVLYGTILSMKFDHGLRLRRWYFNAVFISRNQEEQHSNKCVPALLFKPRQQLRNGKYSLLVI